MNIMQVVAKAYKDVKQAFSPEMWTDSAFVQKSFGLDPSTYRGGLNPYGQLQPLDYENPPLFPQNAASFNYAGLSSAMDAYRRCPPLASILHKKAQCFINGKTWILDEKNKESKSKQAVALKKLFARPNPLQSNMQFEAQGKIYQQLFGFNVVLVIKPIGWDNIDAVSLWNIPPYMLYIQESRKLFYQQQDLKGMIDRVILNYPGGAIDLNIDDLVFFKDFSPSLNSLVLSESRIISLEMPIANIIGAYESRNVLINRRGSLGAWTNDKSDANGTVALTPKEKTDIQKDFSKYGLRFNQYQQIITSAAIKWQQTGYPTKDLMLFEEIEGSTMAICDGFGYPYRLMGAEKSASYADVNEFEKKLYQDTIIPEAHSIYEQWNTCFGLEEYGLHFDKDYSHLPILQADALNMANARDARNKALEREYRYDNITLNRWRELNNEDPQPGGDLLFSQWLALGNTDPYARNSGAAATLQDGVSPTAPATSNNTTNGK